MPSVTKYIKHAKNKGFNDVSRIIICRRHLINEAIIKFNRSLFIHPDVAQYIVCLK